MLPTDEPIHIVNVGIKSGDNEHDSDVILANKCGMFVNSQVGQGVYGEHLDYIISMWATILLQS